MARTLELLKSKTGVLAPFLPTSIVRQPGLTWRFARDGISIGSRDESGARFVRALTGMEMHFWVEKDRPGLFSDMYTLSGPAIGMEEVGRLATFFGDAKKVYGYRPTQLNQPVGAEWYAFTKTHPLGAYRTEREVEVGVVGTFWLPGG